jgi:hypothetical protein
MTREQLMNDRSIVLCVRDAWAEPKHWSQYRDDELWVVVNGQKVSIEDYVD